jgi:LmbE family N-acetylglucosaminyl deacetylase
MRSVLKDSATLVRVAVVVPGPGFFFRWRWFSTYGTYVLEPERRRYCRHVGKPLASDARFSPLLGKTLVLVAHPDDETGGCAALLQHVCEPIVVYATDGAPTDEFFWRRWGSREAYGRVRRSEAERALAAIGVRAVHFLEDHALAPARFADQQLHQALPAAVLAVITLVEQHRPDAILVPAYEGGHPDHDACSFIGFVVGRLMSLPIWEMPLYHRSTDGELICQSFRARNGTEIELKLSASELTSRGRLISHYSSQADLGRFITSDVEYFRPQPRYDYSKPPHEGMVNYEVWEWPVSAVDLCRSFRQCATTWDFEGFVHDAPPMSAASHPPYRLSRPIQAYGI